MASRSGAGTRSTGGLGNGPPEGRAESFDAPSTIVDEIPAPFRGSRLRPPSSEAALAQLEPSYAATRESRDVAELLAAHEVSLARERRRIGPPPGPRPSLAGPTVQVSDSDIESELPAAVEDFEDAMPTLSREPTPALSLSSDAFPSRTVELPPLQPASVPATPPSLLSRVLQLPLPMRVAMVVGWMVLAGAVETVVSRTVARRTAPAISTQTPEPPAAPVAAPDPPAAVPEAAPVVAEPPLPTAVSSRTPEHRRKTATAPRKRAASAAALKSHRPNPF
jgi:hypothetical protein